MRQDNVLGVDREGGQADPLQRHRAVLPADGAPVLPVLRQQRLPRLHRDIQVQVHSGWFLEHFLQVTSSFLSGQDVIVFLKLKSNL